MRDSVSDPEELDLLRAAGAGDPTTRVALRSGDSRQSALPVALRTVKLTALHPTRPARPMVTGARRSSVAVCCSVAPSRCWLFRLPPRLRAVCGCGCWRIAGLKLLFPFSMLVAIGAWLGFPVQYPDDPAPATLLEAFSRDSALHFACARARMEPLAAAVSRPRGYRFSPLHAFYGYDASCASSESALLRKRAGSSVISTTSCGGRDSCIRAADGLRNVVRGHADARWCA